MAYLEHIRKISQLLIAVNSVWNASLWGGWLLWSDAYVGKAAKYGVLRHWGAAKLENWLPSLHHVLLHHSCIDLRRRWLCLCQSMGLRSCKVFKLTITPEFLSM